MITAKGNTILKNVIKFEPEIGELAGNSYNVQMLVCGNPACDCGYAEMKFRNSQNDDEVVAKLNVNVHEKTIQLPKEYPSLSEYILETMNEGMKEEDWVTMERGYYLYKNMMSEDFDLAKVEVEFPEALTDDPSKMQPYLEYLPAAAQFHVKQEGKTVYLLDYYCINPTCGCTHLYFDVVREKENLGLLWYDYKERQVVDGSDAIPLNEANSYLRDLRNRYKGFEERLQKRHQNIKGLFIKHLKINNLSVGEKQLREITKISRNALCPCGSGKKYKKCCMGK